MKSPMYTLPQNIYTTLAKPPHPRLSKLPLYSHRLSLHLPTLISDTKINMGHIFDKLNGKDWRRKQMQIITDRVFDRIKDESGRTSLSFEELYIAVLLVYKLLVSVLIELNIFGIDINKRLPGPHFDPPTKETVKAVLQECDMNLDGELNPEEFSKFIKRLTKDTFFVISQGLLITLAVAPIIAILTKRTTEGVPVIGKVVAKVPSSVYASVVTLAVVMYQKAQESKE